MIKKLLALFASAALCAAAPSAHATRIVDTGAPNGQAVGAYAFDSADWYAAQVDFAAASRIDAIFGHVLDGAAGETFHVSLYADDGAGAPGAALQSATAVFGADGWNGVSGLSGWNVAAGDYWVGLEVWGTDTIGSTSATGALLDQGAPTPLADTDFSSASGADYASTGTPLSIGLRIDATSLSAVPWPAQGPLMLYGLLLLFAFASGRRQRD
jgi:hypothetical protein